ncbi:spermidine/putrescine ABC transporter substrate-binding protein [Streptomyces sp. YIM 98790]|uniref:polyamine ABC transporter substrate-binding protein n=1 Tax=Streptomyces sp. YIM 98790 TaxID=2689077 RepID=UPI00140B2EC6|nr:spermidine/putrescine ABC transporter substrate-binding protein [Streptomyces sp. YIM 98790]
MSEPVRQAWLRSLTNGRAARALSRRRLLQGSGALTGAALLAACGIPASESGKDTEDEGGQQDLSAEEKVLNFSNWPLYIDVDDENPQVRPTLDAFRAETGIEVAYTEDINDNNEFFGKIRPQLAAGQDTGRDLIVVTDWMAGRLIRQGWANRLDPTNVPNAIANVEGRYRNAPHDPGRQYTYPWAGLATVIAYNRKATGGREITSVSELLDDPGLKGKVSLLTEMQDTIGMVLLDMGKDPGTFTDDDFDAAVARVQQAVDSGQLRRFTGNDYMDELNSGDIAACLAWAGDIVQLQYDNPDIAFTIPEQGYLFFTDDLLVPARARHQANAEALIDYYYRPEVAAELAAWVNYFCPVAGAQVMMERIDAELAQNTLIFPDQEMTERGYAFRPLQDAEETAYQEKFAKLIGA